MDVNIVSKNPIPFHNDGRVMFVHFLNNYWGDCTLVEIPEGDGTYTNLLIDMGYGREGREPRPGGIRTLRLFLQYFLSSANRKIHKAVISHWHDDHYNEFEKLLSDNEIAPDSIWAPDHLTDDILASDLWTQIKKFHNKFYFIHADSEPIISSNDGRVMVTVIGPPSPPTKISVRGGRTSPIYIDPSFKSMSEKPEKGWKRFPIIKTGSTINNYSLVLRLEYCGKVVLFPGDVEEIGWHHLVPAKYGTPAWITGAREVLRCDLLKIPHHGREAQAFSFRPLPQYAVCTRFKTDLRKLNQDGRDKSIDFEVFVRRPGETEPGLVEEVFHMGLDELASRVTCSFAFVPNRSGTDAIIVPIIYKLLGYRGKDPKFCYFIRPAERDCI